ncbi:hypothetical protein H5410_013385 [Solanum commersonii]|uniref:Uncharacterized protein n=1 Tax=Solanum commersonii TaxID=4109 RepID=A0A9J6AVL1_SOLCO|nr:hypothetical protein H5410_013385 [Solanum commersonii]
MSQESWVCGSFFLTAWYLLDLLILKERAAEELEVLLRHITVSKIVNDTVEGMINCKVDRKLLIYCFSVSTTLCGSVMAGGWSIEALFSLEEATVSSVNNMS